MKRLAVQDANVLIDLWNIGLLEQVFALELEMHSTDFVINELLDVDQRTAIDQLVDQGQLKIHTFDPTDLRDLINFHAQQGQLSLEDCSVWKLAESRRAILLTTDGALRRKAQAAGIEVHGSLWLLDELLREDIIEKETACNALLLLMNSNNRLPAVDCAVRRNNWCGENDKK